ncbi:hypothetical protein WA026_014737 [Henosepilachna vigintioctopunctata]|uniref:Uncharacterized protein n=1 Tax=Henosepilachna vigintioctopunctata TaxID=420089 RepID=A0AAW1VEA0_9CUCU
MVIEGNSSLKEVLKSELWQRKLLTLFQICPEIISIRSRKKFVGCLRAFRRATTLIEPAFGDYELFCHLFNGICGKTVEKDSDQNLSDICLYDTRKRVCTEIRSESNEASIYSTDDLFVNVTVLISAIPLIPADKVQSRLGSHQKRRQEDRKPFMTKWKMQYLAATYLRYRLCGGSGCNNI